MDCCTLDSIYCTVTVTFAHACSAPYVPLTVTVYWPFGVVEAVLTVKVAGVPGCT